MDDDIAVEGSFYSIPTPKRSNWVCYISGSPKGPVSGTVTFRPCEGNVPNWFNRIMMRLFFGFIWVRDNNE